MQHQPALPVGTQIVILAAVTGPGDEPVVPAGAVGVIVAQLDERSYRIRFPDGDEAIVQREDITTRAHLQRAGLQQDRSSSAQVDLYEYNHLPLCRRLTSMRLHRDFDAAFATTRLPERPDYERANAYLLRVRRSVVS
jgi:hypothetical protein